MPPLPVVSGAEFYKILERLGWVFLRTEGSHRIYRHSGRRNNLSVPDHKELAKGTLRTLIRDAGLTRDEFVRLHRER